MNWQLHSVPLRSRPIRRLSYESLEGRQLLAIDAVELWNDEALASIRATSANPLVASRNLAILHTAVFDAVNAIDRTHVPYSVDELADPRSSREAAVAAAAHAVLVASFPARKAMLDQALTAALAAIPDGLSETLGKGLGERVAAKMLALRAQDGSTATSTYTAGSAPGDWRPTPPANAAALLPRWGEVTPFGVSSIDPFSPPGVPSLSSAAYATAYNEVAGLGRDASSVRTAEQTTIARFWASGAGTATPPGHLNRLARAISEDRGLSLSENARLFALLNVALADAGILAWDAKYATDFWRPITAIRNGESDGNSTTSGVTDWTPLLTTPPFPTYVSGHATFSGAAERALVHYFGTDQIRFTIPSEDASLATRTFLRISSAAQESADSRLFGGIHFRFDNEDGLAAGRRLGDAIAANQLRSTLARARAGLVGGAFVVFGTERRDSIYFVSQGNHLAVFHQGRRLARFARSEVQEIVVDARGGNDHVVLGEVVRVKGTLLGGDGDDFLMGGRSDDEIHGGRGNDHLHGLGGRDRLFGDEGNDWLFGGAGDDELTGGTGRNRQFGGRGRNTTR